ncbi:hypothetical protein TrST_g13892 [Triparma strigata]|uniref:Uncharacterized protein n=1 Tax=Triparma strigata TaxID=1606541 RepID=A0A9W7BEQ7_9STRA|nr:hypothetical protein TrST_g13892 [Triparma strigata]|mmetsp:Transcript_11059/g.20001  ORF Transcript_11059/g.20001 Transcript_11059/m.20001 type:complete len:465 (-) Transcript_11059:20-1414(-)
MADTAEGKTEPPIQTGESPAVDEEIKVPVDDSAVPELEEKKDEPELVSSTVFEELGVSPPKELGAEAYEEQLSQLRKENDALSSKVEGKEGEIEGLEGKVQAQTDQISQLKQTANILQSEKEEELRRNIAHLTAALAEKDASVSNLVKEVDRRTDAIRSCGEEIVKLRRHTKALEDERETLAKKLSEKERQEEQEMGRIAQLVQGEVGSQQVPEALLNQMRILTHKFTEAQMLLQAKDEEVADITGELEKYQEKEAQYNDMQRVAGKQAKALGKMGKLEDKVAAYKSTVGMQEKVIAKLEAVIENKIREDARKGPAAWAKMEIQDKLRSEELEKELGEKTEELEDLRASKKSNEVRIAELEQDLRIATDRALSAEAAHSTLAAAPKLDPQLEEKLQVQKLKVEALTEQMQNNAKDAQKEISELKVKLFEFEMADMGGMGDELDSVMGGMSANTSLSSLVQPLAR